MLRRALSTLKWQFIVGMSVEMPRAVMGTVPDAHGIVTQHDGLPFDRDFR